MKSIITLAIVAFVAVSVRAETQSTTAKTKSAATKVAKKKKHKKKAKKSEASVVKASESAAADEAVSATVADSSSAIEAGSQSYQVKESALQKIRKNLSLSLSQETYGGAFGSTDASTYNGTETDMVAKLSYKINDTTSVALANEWDHIATFDNPALKGGSDTRTIYQDPYLGISKSGVVKTDSGFSIDTSLRAYAPVSAASQAEGLATQLRAYGILSQEITKKLTASLVLSPRWYIGTNRTFTDPMDGSVGHGQNFRFLSDLSLSYALSDKLSVQQMIGMYQVWGKGSGYSNWLDASTSVAYSPTKLIALEAGIRQAAWSTNLTGGSGQTNAIYSEGQAEYFLGTTLSL